MGVVPELIRVGLHLACVAIDMALVLLFFRVIGQRRQVRWIVTINDAAKEVVDCLTGAIGLRWRALMSIRLSQQGALAASMITLCIARFVLQQLAELLR